MSSEVWEIDRIWDSLAARFDRETVTYYRKLAESPSEGFEEAKDQFAEEVATLTGSSHDINRAAAKRRLILAHLILAVFDGLRRGETEWKPVPPSQENWEAEETALLVWAAQHGMADERLTRLRASFGSKA